MSIFKGKKEKGVVTEPKGTAVVSDTKMTHAIVRRVLERQHTSEKAYSSEGQRKYVFVVLPSANKSLVKHDIENRYNVKVESVNIVRRAGKMKRVGFKTGRRSEIKKAIVTLREGNKIELT